MLKFMGKKIFTFCAEYCAKKYAYLNQCVILTFLALAAFSSSDILAANWAATLAKYIITFLVFSVFPAPDSPLWRRIITWLEIIRAC